MEERKEGEMEKAWLSARVLARLASLGSGGAGVEWRVAPWMWEDDEEEASVVASWEGEGRVVLMVCFGGGGGRVAYAGLATTGGLGCGG